jgi:hypothetical protein
MAFPSKLSLFLTAPDFAASKHFLFCSERLVDSFFWLGRFSFASCCSTANVYLRIKSSENVMCDIFGEAKRRLAREIDSNLTLPSKPIAADPWVVSSLLQKSIRRGETEIAWCAALTLFNHRGSSLWRRLMVIAFEDVGIGSLDVVTMTVAAAGDSAWRKNHGGDFKLAVYLAGLLAEAPKDRSADYLCDAKDHPIFAGVAEDLRQARVHGCRRPSLKAAMHCLFWTALRQHMPLSTSVRKP